MGSGRKSGEDQGHARAGEEARARASGQGSGLVRAGPGSALKLRDVDKGEGHEVPGPELVLIHRQQAQVADLRPWPDGMQSTALVSWEEAESAQPFPTHTSVNVPPTSRECTR